MRVTKITDIPTVPHWVIVTMTKVSRTEPNPDSWRDGDNYVTYAATETDLQTFLEEAEWRKVLEDLILRKAQSTSMGEIVAYHVDKVAQTSIKPVVEIK